MNVCKDHDYCNVILQLPEEWNKTITFTQNHKSMKILFLPMWSQSVFLKKFSCVVTIQKIFRIKIKQTHDVWIFIIHTLLIG